MLLNLWKKYKCWSENPNPYRRRLSHLGGYVRSTTFQFIFSYIFFLSHWWLLRGIFDTHTPGVQKDILLAYTHVFITGKKEEKPSLLTNRLIVCAVLSTANQFNLIMVHNAMSLCFFKRFAVMTKFIKAAQIK